MADIALKPIILNNASLKIDADNYEASVNKLRLVPTTPVVAWKGMKPGSNLNQVGEPTWVLELGFAQDHDTANSMSLYLAANVGQEKTVAIKPVKPGTAPTTNATYTVKVLIVPGPVGGDLDTIAVGDVSLPVNGQPVRTVAA